MSFRISSASVFKPKLVTQYNSTEFLYYFRDIIQRLPFNFSTTFVSVSRATEGHQFSRPIYTPEKPKPVRRPTPKQTSLKRKKKKVNVRFCMSSLMHRSHLSMQGSGATAKQAYLLLVVIESTSNQIPCNSVGVAFR